MAGASFSRPLITASHTRWDCCCLLTSVNRAHAITLHAKTAQIGANQGSQQPEAPASLWRSHVAYRPDNKIGKGEQMLVCAMLAVPYASFSYSAAASRRCEAVTGPLPCSG